MPKRAKELSAIEVKRLTKPGLYAVGGVAGLHLSVSPSGARSWILRYATGQTSTSSTGREYAVRRDLGLGAYPEISLAMARQKAVEAKEQLKAGVDPVDTKKALRAHRIAAQRNVVTFDEAARRFLAGKTKEFSNPKHAAQWEATLKTYASPVLGKMQVADIELAHIIRVLEPEWTTKTETMTRLRGRIENVLSWATVHGYRKGDNPARWQGNLDAVLPKPGKVATVKHHRALPWKEMPSFIPLLLQREGMAARALEFLILTATRSGEVRGATWAEIDLQERVWTIPATRMKASREHRVPLPGAALELLAALPRLEGSEYLFPAPRGGPLSDMTLSAVCKRMQVDAVPHGFRSAFRDWTAEATGYPNEVCEKALAHGIRDKSEAAYRRGDLLEKRRPLMNDWAEYLYQEVQR
ncbi:tyrosine-type recombinase/integrase [Desulfurivibrio sp. C05AmB]|uniref:tyrosine-type recombinase/integrase n=1 Tax=Desulfurivibrio sp. C05AmB TaxID=3374371 RepID=UPI00376F465D